MEKNTEKLYCYLPAKPYVQPGSIHFQLLYIQQHRSLLVLHLHTPGEQIQNIGVYWYSTYIIHTPGEQIQNIGVQLLVLHLHTPEAQILNIGVYWYSTYICQGNKSRIQESIGTPPTYAGGTNLENRSLLVLHLRTPEHKSRIYESIGTPPTYAGGTNLDYRSLLVLHLHMSGAQIQTIGVYQYSTYIIHTLVEQIQKIDHPPPPPPPSHPYLWIKFFIRDPICK